MNGPDLTRRNLLRAVALGGAGLAISGCRLLDGLAEIENPTRRFMENALVLNFRVQRALMRPGALVPEYRPEDIRQAMRPNGATAPDEEEYLRLKAGGFEGYRLLVDGLVDNPLSLDLASLRAMPSRTQITRHDCVEGWSCIAQWTGTPLAEVLAQARPRQDARFAVFWCYGSVPMFFSEPKPYYESIDMVDALHPQTILAYDMNGGALPEANGAPLRLRVERQLGYKMAKFVHRIELVRSFATIQGGRGGFWEDEGYGWYAGI